MIMSCSSMDQRAPLGRILAGWIAILLCSLLLYDALLYSSLRTATREGTQASASVAATALKSRMAIGIRFGKKLETYHNVDRLLASVGQAADMPLAVLDARGMALHHWGRFPLLPDISDRLPKTGTEAVLSLKDGELLLAPVADRDEHIVGHIAVWMPSRNLDATLRDLFRQQLLFQGGLALAGILLLSLCLGLRRSGGMPRNLCIAIFLLLMLGNGALALHAVSRQYTQGLRNDAAHTGAILTEDLNRLLLVGVSLDDTSRLSAYLTRAATAHGDDLVLEVLAPSGKVFASSHASGPFPELLPPGEEFPLLELASALLCVGFLNYFLPVFLKQADVAQSNIGRIYMLNCLIVIYSGPLFARLVGNSLRKGPLLFWAGILSALSVACFCFLPPLPASVAGSILLGLATGLNIPAQSEFLLELDIARAIGVDQAMSLLDALQRVGQVIGPVCVGAVMAIMSVDDAARWAGIILVAISLLFLLLVRPTRHSGDRA